MKLSALTAWRSRVRDDDLKRPSYARNRGMAARTIVSVSVGALVDSPLLVPLRLKLPFVVMLLRSLAPQPASMSRDRSGATNAHPSVARYARSNLPSSGRRP